MKTKIDFPIFKSTVEAIEFGKRVTEEEKNQLYRLRLDLLKQFDFLMKQDDLDGASVVATQAQFYKEAIKATEIIYVVNELKNIVYTGGR